ncbi:expressed unknown protein [Seminavis robusta]|uniref:VWFD domain-containing protein n=1 Tax=Seminavis robusta TaxID=568900 RepID=A0A9N8DDB4_9STRA|nr:expressed unknown protein [Seminavis robusta]|eukprot:Sro94_g049091.1  (445) ;mRNA; f:98591-99925
MPLQSSWDQIIQSSQFRFLHKPKAAQKRPSSTSFFCFATMKFSSSILFAASLFVANLGATFGHGVQMLTCISPAGGLRVFIEHWHEHTAPAISPGDTIQIQKNTETSVPTAYTGTVFNVPETSLGYLCKGNAIPMHIASCGSKADTYNDWGWFDFPSVDCNAPSDTYTIEQGNTVVFREDCSHLYPQTFSISGICDAATGRIGGDPHIQTWDKKWYDFHGQCDLVFLENEEFNDGQGMDIHVRTTARYQYSYIEAAALRIGDDVLQVSSHGNYFLNAIGQASMPATLGGHNVTYSVDDNKKHTFVTHLGDGRNVVIQTFKDWVNVKLDAADMKNYGNSKGLLGEFPTGDWVGRDNSIFTNANEFGQEWQVRDTDAKLFAVNREPQFPQKCVMPDPKSAARRLGESIAKATAERVCDHWAADEKDLCVFDVMASGDLEHAAAGAF